ncbi:MAG TPA: RNA 2',3'-cyclic phosphodiesterase, partial [Candidatus Polarisedimenticolia bacterium]|nr:RNA 2',3'-cyclic phosphodiesterase [Candidatus Polarisedimenticolia bacterium]
PPGLRGRLTALQERLRDVPLDLRLVNPSGIHLTLRFIGELAEERVDDIVAALAAPASAGLSRFTLRAAGLGVFPPRGAPRVIWIDLEGEREPAARLAAAVDAALVQCGLAAEQRPFTPHLTVARVRGVKRADWQAALAALAEERLGDLIVDRYHLYESQLGRGGATYRKLSTWELSGGADR